MQKIKPFKITKCGTKYRVETFSPIGTFYGNNELDTFTKVEMSLISLGATRFTELEFEQAFPYLLELDNYNLTKDDLYEICQKEIVKRIKNKGGN